MDAQTTPTLPKTAQFVLKAGSVYFTPGALKALTEEDMSDSLFRHLTGDWGNLCDEDKEENDRALKAGGRILSSYLTEHSKEKFWIITEADRSATTILLPSEY